VGRKKIKNREKEYFLSGSGRQRFKLLVRKEMCEQQLKLITENRVQIFTMELPDARFFLNASANPGVPVTGSCGVLILPPTGYPIRYL
jgi:hypothetical protein